MRLVFNNFLWGALAVLNNRMYGCHRLNARFFLDARLFYGSVQFTEKKVFRMQIVKQVTNLVKFSTQTYRRKLECGLTDFHATSQTDNLSGTSLSSQPSTNSSNQLPKFHSAGQLSQTGYYYDSSNNLFRKLKHSQSNREISSAAKFLFGTHISGLSSSRGPRCRWTLIFVRLMILGSWWAASQAT